MTELLYPCGLPSAPPPACDERPAVGGDRGRAARARKLARATPARVERVGEGGEAAKLGMLGGRLAARVGDEAAAAKGAQAAQVRGHLVPPIIIFLAKHPVVDQFDISSMTNIISAAAPLGKETQVTHHAQVNI